MTDSNDKRPVAVCIGRQFGCGGREVGRLVAERLGYAYYDKELLVEAANSSGVSPEVFAAADERAPKFFSNLWSFNMGLNAGSYIAGNNPLGSDSIYFAQSDVVRELASRGNCVMVGRTADHVLRAESSLCRVVAVFLHAPIAERVRRIIARGDASDEREAERLALERNEARADYYNFYTNGRWGEAETYDLSVDVSLLGDDGTAALIADFVSKVTGRRVEKLRG